MAPTPQEYAQESQGVDVEDVPDDAIVISGVSGLMPGCDSYVEFGDKLFMKENLVTKNNRWKDYSHPDLPEHYGMINGVHKFDAQFFTVVYKLAHSSEPGSRKIYEQTYQAIFDSGHCPSELSNKHIGVFLAVSVLDTDKTSYDKNVILGLIGNSRSIFANRISFWLNLKGPSETLDGEACGIVVAMEQACQAMMKGKCEAAIVGSAKLLLHPQIPVIYNRECSANPDGKSKCYDANADGQSLSEAVNVMFLQKHKDAKRVYAIVRHAKAEFSCTDEVVTSEMVRVPRDVHLLSNFYRKFYEEAGVEPSSVEYIEGFGAANQYMDKLELQALEQVFCKDRKNPLLVGSVASNTGYTEASSAACAIFKLLHTYQRGQIPASINCENPRQDIAAIRDGRMRVLTEHASLLRARTAVNSFSLTGLNGHVLLERYGKKKDPSRYLSNIPYLVMASGRQESSVQKILDDLMTRQLDPEEIALLHIIFKNRIGLHMARGIGIYSSEKEKTITHCQKVDYYDGVKRPLWFVYSGMGSQWVGMGYHLMRIPLFAESIQRCHRILEPRGIDLINIITTKDKKIYDNILHSFVGISSIQIALTDLLRAIGLVPDNIIGHSLGELGCAYADGCFTAEQVLDMAYLRGHLSTTTPLTRGAMAAIGLGFKQIVKMCPPEIDVACHNSATSCTISGPAEVVKEFVERMMANGIFAKEVLCSNIAYHSRYIAALGAEFMKQSKEMIKNPKLRSDRWLSSSVPQDRWNEDIAKYSSAEYHTNNVLNTVLFEETLRFVPSNAVLVEIAPHGLLQAILKRALPTSCQHIPLTLRGHSDSALFLLEALGNLYMQGHDLDITPLYPKVELPVSSATRSLSHMVEWVHSEDWKACRFVKPKESYNSELNLKISLEDDEFQYLRGHRIEGMCVFPFAASLVAVWDLLCMSLNLERKKLSVQFHNLKFYSQPALFEHQLQYLTVTLQRGSGNFEVFDGKVIVIEGTITSIAKGNISYPNSQDNITMNLSQEDIYKLFYARGHEYTDQFRCLQSTNSSMTEAKIQWKDNWVTFIDAMIQMSALKENHQGISKLSYISRLIIDFKKNMNERIYNNDLLSFSYDEIQKRTRCGGVFIENITFKVKPLSKIHDIVLNTFKFMPFYQNENKDIFAAMSILIQMIAENKNKDKITIAYVNVPNKLDYIKKIKNVIHSLPKIKSKFLIVTIQDILEYKQIEEKLDAILLHDLISDKKVFEALYHIVLPDTFIISVGADTRSCPFSIYKPVAAIGNGRSKVELAKFKPSPAAAHTTAISIRSVSDIHHLHINCENLTPHQRLLVLAPYPAPVGLIDQVNRWRKRNNNVSMVMFDQQRNVMDKELENIPDMPFSVLHDGVWGSEYYVPTTCDPNPTKREVALRCSRPGDLDSLTWVQANAPFDKRGIDVNVHYAGLTSIDASAALAETCNWSTDDGFGMDFSGVTARGERVMGLLPRGAAASKVRVDPNMLWPVPAHWTLEDAATVPYAYAHAMYCLYITIWLMPKMKVLITGGTGALGQAAISIALAHGCQVFTTVSDVRKKQFLRKLFPQLKDHNIGNSRDDSYQDIIKKATNGIGCDIILSCAKGEIKKQFFTCLAWNGVIVDTAQLATRENINYEYRFLSPCNSYYAVDFNSVFEQRNVMDMKKLQSMLSEGIIRGYVRPISRVTYEPHEVPRAFRLLTASRHRGRVLLSLRDKTLVVEPRLSCHPSSSHVVIYNDELLGLQVADLLVKRGAKNIFIHGDQTLYLRHKIECWEGQDVTVKASSANLTKKDEALSLLKQSNGLGDVEGIYVVSSNTSGSADAVASVMTNLDLTSRKVCPNLRHFALISEHDKACRETIRKRADDGFPSLSVQLRNLQKFVSSKDINNEAPSTDFSLPPQSAISAIEKALYSGDNVVLAHAQPIVRLSILEEVAKIPGVNITNATVDRTNLEQVGVDHGRAQELCNLLEEKFHITISPDVVPQMTIGQLKELKLESEDIEQEVPGLWPYLSSFHGEELLATTDMVVMPTLVHRSELRPEEFDSDHDYLCIVPGLEGHHARFRSLCERLKIPAAVLQPGNQHLNETILDTAKRMSNVILKYLKPKKGFNILGYEFGVLVALEIAAILESHGYTGTVYMLGATPEDFCSSFNERWKNSDEANIQNTLLQHMYSLITKTASTGLGDALKNTENWSDKVDALLRAVRNQVSHSTQYIEGTIQGIYSRIMQVKDYKIHPQRLRSKVVLLQAKPYKSSVENLKHFSAQEPAVNNLRATFSHAYKDLSCSNIINRYLEPEILEEYENSNHCEKGAVSMEDIIKQSTGD